METLSNDTVHASTSIAPNNAHIDVQNTDDLSKEKEEELLYGIGEDGEEEDALSDDSLRLRFSEDEAEIEDITLVSTSSRQSEHQIKNMDKESKEEKVIDLESCNEADASEKININRSDINCEVIESTLPDAKLLNNDNEIVDLEMNSSDNISNDNLPDSKNLNNVITKEEKKEFASTGNDESVKNFESNIKAQDKEINISVQNDRKDLTSKNEDVLDKDCGTIIFDSKNDKYSTLDKGLLIDEKQDIQEINSTDIMELNQLQRNDTDIQFQTSKSIQSSNIRNGNGKILREERYSINKKVNNNKPGKKQLDKENDSCQTQNNCLKNQPEKLNDNGVHNTKGMPEAINVEIDLIEPVISTDENSAMSRTTSLESGDTKNASDDNEKSADASKTKRRKRRSKKLLSTEQDAVQDGKQGAENGRQKRRTAKNAEEIIRKKFLVQDSDIESSDSSEKLVTVNCKVIQQAQPLSPPSLKRARPDTDNVTVNGNTKKQKKSTELVNEDITIQDDHRNDIRNLNYINKFFRRDLKEKLPKLKQGELEELLIQKIVESITMRGEIGRLREQARISEKSQEATRTRCQQLAKQIKDFEMVLSRNAADRRANNDKPTPPIKINRSVGLQVNFITDHGIQSLRQLQQNPVLKPVNITNTAPASVNPVNAVVTNETNNNASNPRKGLKVRSPRKPESCTVTQSVPISSNSVQPPPLIPTVTPAALVVSKPVEPQHPVSLQTQANSIQQMLPNQQQSVQQPQTVIVNGKVPHQTSRQSAATVNVTKTKTNDLIDLTDEEEKSKSIFNNKPQLSITAVTTSTVTDQPINIISKSPNCFPRVIQTLPANVAVANRSASIRVVHTASHPTPTALVNNMNAARLTYVMQGGVGTGRQLLITSNANQIRPVTPCNRPPFATTLAYKTGISTNANGTVQVLTTSSGPNVQLNKHPAPLPDTPYYAINSVLKLPPPAPSLKISKVANGIVLSWNMTLSDKYADIVSFQLYAYQEVAGVPPSTNLWKKVGDVLALPLPMACTLTQFSEGNNYYFAVRAVDKHSRKGQYSAPGNISL